jgi:uncharacterized membrane protein YhaH (DUF805 family)
MDFFEAIKSCFSRYATFSGRASRSEYWWWVLFVLLASIATAMVSSTVSGLFSLGTLLPFLAVAARRLHDIGKSGWWQLVGFIPLLGWIMMIYWTVQPSEGPNTYGDGPASSAGA